MSKYKKKGFGGVVSTLIMFIAIISVTTGLVIAFTNYIRTTEQSMSVQNELTVNKLKTSVSVTNVNYDDSENILNVYLKNIGETKLNSRFFDLYVDGVFQKDFNVTQAANFSDVVILLEPKDTVSVNKKIVLNPGTHEVIVVTEYGNSAKDSFNI